MLTIHIILLVVTVLMMAYFVFAGVLPFKSAIGYETRRIAELIRHAGLCCACCLCLPRR